MATGSFDGKVQGLNQLQQQEQRKYGRGNYMPNIEVIYWSMRVMAFAGVLMFLVAALGAWLYWRKKLERARWFHWTAIVGLALPYIAATAGWILTEMGRQPWIVNDLLKTADANSPAVSTTWVAISLSMFVALYALLLVLDIWLMRRYARRDPQAADEADESASPPLAPPTDGDDMSLADLWFILVAFLWSGYFLLEGFDFGVGMLLPFLPRNDADRSAMFRTIGPVWDGNEVWLVMAGGATFAAFPAWYATMFSGFYLALLLVLFFLIVRVLSFEWRTKSPKRALAHGLDVGEHNRKLRGVARLGSRPLGPALRRPDRLEWRLLRRLR